MVLALARGALAFVPSMWAWGLNVQRFLTPLPAWLPWSLTLLALHPAFGEWLSRPFERAGNRLAAGAAGGWFASVLGAALVWSLPDRTWIMGDFMLRQGWAEGGSIPSFGQSLPIEILIDGVIPRLFTSLSPADANVATRVIGAAAAGALAAVAVRLVRAWDLQGAAALTAGGIVFFGGYLTAFSGIGKPAAVMCVLAALAALASVRFARTGEAQAALGITLALALLTHRGALLMMPMWVVALLAARNAGPERRPPRLWWAVVPPLLSLIAVAPLIWRIAQTLDIPRHLAPPPVRSVGILAAAFDARHLADLANLVMFYTPMVVLLPVLGLTRGFRDTDRLVMRLQCVLAAPFVPLLLLAHPKQGIVRDLEAFAIAGVSVSLLAAYAIGSALQRRSLPAWMAPALLLAVLAPCLQWLVHFHDTTHGIDRVRAIALEQPTRSDVERAQLWDGIAYRAFRLRQWDEAVEASAQSVRYAPHPRSLMMWAIARTYAGDHLGAESLYVAMAERMPDDPLVWVGLGGASLRLQDSVQISRSLDRLHSYAPDGREARIIRRHLHYFPEVWPEPRGRPVTPP